MDSDGDTACAVGCPIRRSRDQRSLASPPGFSQRATSFIASQCQGIHQMPLLALERHTQRQRPDIRKQNSDIRSQNHRGGKLSSQKTLRDPKHGLSAVHGFPLRSHNSLLYDCPSANAPASPDGDAEGISRVLLAAFSGCTRCRRLSGFCCAKPCRRDRPEAAARRNLRLRRWWR